LAESHQEEQMSESSKVLIELDPPKTVDSSSAISVPEIAANLQRIETEKHELSQKTTDLQLNERELRNKVIEEIDRRWTAIESLKSEIITLQKKFNELTPQIVSNRTIEKSKTSSKNMRQKRTLLASLIVAAGLIFYALGIATNFFALPVFSSFFILSNYAAHQVSYIAAVAGVALIAAILTLNFRKNDARSLGLN
jgi:hypothetical protein